MGKACGGRGHQEDVSFERAHGGGARGRDGTENADASAGAPANASGAFPKGFLSGAATATVRGAAPSHLPVSDREPC